VALAADATVSLGDERRESGIDEVFAALDRQLVGLLPVKKKVEEIASLLLVDRVRQQFGLTAPRPNLHMCFTGEPGTGKTTMALQMGDLLHRLGYLEKGHVVHAMRDDLVGQFIGHTAPKTKRVIEEAFGGVLFIDEAYYLYRASDSKDYGQECIDILMQVMENDRDKLVVILAGYKDRMEEFFQSNPGMSSRVAHHLDFAPYRLDELVAIGKAMLGEASYYLSDSAETALRDYLTMQMDQPRFANARSVRNELEQARLLMRTGSRPMPTGAGPKMISCASRRPTSPPPRPSPRPASRTQTRRTQAKRARSTSFRAAPSGRADPGRCYRRRLGGVHRVLVRQGLVSALGNLGGPEDQGQDHRDDDIDQQRAEADVHAVPEFDVR
jgi:probable Rubsico expression protein CbbX